MNSGPLIVLQGGFGRAAEKLADTIRHVVDVAISPDRLRATAQARAEVEVILAKGRAEAQDIEARAADRVRRRENRRQSNLESITKQAFLALPPPEQLSDEPVNQDWTSRFFRDCEDISDEQMQQIWARILAGEVARPGRFAPRTLSVTRDLTKQDANLFTKLCQFGWVIPDAGFVPVIHDCEAPEVEAAGINFAVLTHLTTMGLIELNLMGYGIKSNPTEIAPSYCGKVYQLKSDGGQPRTFELGCAMLTVAGQELAPIAGAQSNDEYRTMALEGWSQRGWKEAGQAEAAPT
jgi:hypothetical protein